ncbi:YqjF family protein [Negadavirga shengliensis]|uniref:YqjF family protein n=1 Tax=Negadavirga shengliensis TaxID=1389218 RepID=A0ABV9T3N6_9BACT
MTIKEILNTTGHRPWKLPAERWKYYQEWNNAVFLHWQVAYEEIRKFVPDDLEIDLFEGKPWVSLVAFTMEKVRPRKLPSFSPLSDFDEINIRTYVKHNNKTGVYFLSIEGGTKISCQLAKALSALPYRYSKIERRENIYYSENKQSNDKLKIIYQVGRELKEKTELDKWLLERYALFQDTQASINEFEIHHAEWPAFKIDLKEIKIEYPKFNELLDNSPDRIHYSTGVQVVAWDRKKYTKLAHKL